MCSCPQCRQIFSPRPNLGKNSLLAEVVEKLRLQRGQTGKPGHAAAGPEDVECGVCTGVRLKAVKSCLECLDSYCQKHLSYHEELHAGKHHRLMDPSLAQLQEKTCPDHHKLREVFCRTDQQVICLECIVDKHCGHKIVPVATERAEKQVRRGCLEAVQFNSLQLKLAWSPISFGLGFLVIPHRITMWCCLPN